MKSTFVNSVLLELFVPSSNLRMCLLVHALDPGIEQLGIDPRYRKAEDQFGTDDELEQFGVVRRSACWVVNPLTIPARWLPQ